MLLKHDQSCLLLIDVQEKLAPHVLKEKELLARCEWLMSLANEMKVPMLVSEQYPKGLGVTVSPLRELAGQSETIEKVYFSCWRDAGFKAALQAVHRKQLILIGMETHVCVLQTALDLVEAGYDVFVVVDAVSSRHEPDYRYGLKRMKQHGVNLITSEMVLFEWVEKAGTPEFKALSKGWLQ
ncbi:hydrolase [Legionella sp. CNM-4043-24]|uniref:hydrolase n=1 Tax=Legionella sp. CNM-4043-24 TaxID=3421646 RepID=UPI00403AB488